MARVSFSFPSFLAAAAAAAPQVALALAALFRSCQARRAGRVPGAADDRGALF